MVSRVIFRPRGIKQHAREQKLLGLFVFVLFGAILFLALRARSKGEELLRARAGDDSTTSVFSDTTTGGWLQDLQERIDAHIPLTTPTTATATNTEVPVVSPPPPRREVDTPLKPAAATPPVVFKPPLHPPIPPTETPSAAEPPFDASVAAMFQRIQVDISTTGRKLPVLPILMFACNRVDIVRALDALVEHAPSAATRLAYHPIIVSQDCKDSHEGKKVTEIVMRYSHHNVALIHYPSAELFTLPADANSRFAGYYKIAQHFHWGLKQIFDMETTTVDGVIILEDDMEISPDFYEYFLAGYHVLEQDDTLWCVSAWNDNGQPQNVRAADHTVLHRSDFFPGLGWLMTRELWTELGPKWPLGFWDDWMREPEQRRARACIRPEISRVYNFGKKGTSNGQFFDKYIGNNLYNHEAVAWMQKDLSYLQKTNYDSPFIEQVYAAPKVSSKQAATNAATSTVLWNYDSMAEFDSIARQLGIMDGEKAGVPRTAYLGVVQVQKTDTRIFVAPTVPRKTTYK